MESLYSVSAWLIQKGTGMKHPSKKGNLKLQKLLYYANALNLIINDEPLFSQEIEAWSNGPVVRDAYVHYRYYDLSQRETEVMDKSVEELLELVLKLFDGYSAKELVDMTHDEKPWKQYENQVGSHNYIVISPDEIKEYYSKKFESFLDNYLFEEEVEIGNNVFVYNKRETILTSEDIQSLERDYSEDSGLHLFVYKEEGELVAY